MRPPTPPLVISDEQREVLEKLSVSRTAAHRDVQRASVLLMAGRGMASTRIAAVAGLSATTVAAWRERFEQEGLKAFAGCAREGPQALDPDGEGGRDRARDAAREACGGDALELPLDGQGPGCQPGDGAADLVRARAQAASGQDVQALQRQAVRGEARRRGRPVPEPAGAGDRARAWTRRARSRRSTAPSRRCR